LLGGFSVFRAAQLRSSMDGYSGNWSEVALGQTFTRWPGGSTDRGLGLWGSVPSRNAVTSSTNFVAVHAQAALSGGVRRGVDRERRGVRAPPYHAAGRWQQDPAAFAADIWSSWHYLSEAVPSTSRRLINGRGCRKGKLTERPGDDGTVPELRVRRPRGLPARSTRWGTFAPSGPG